jgi:hypothetical protein
LIILVVREERRQRPLNLADRTKHSHSLGEFFRTSRLPLGTSNAAPFTQSAFDRFRCQGPGGSRNIRHLYLPTEE